MNRAVILANPIHTDAWWHAEAHLHSGGLPFGSVWSINLEKKLPEDPRI